jgi:hypothetical protein
LDFGDGQRDLALTDMDPETDRGDFLLTDMDLHGTDIFLHLVILPDSPGESCGLPSANLRIPRQEPKGHLLQHTANQMQRSSAAGS